MFTPILNTDTEERLHHFQDLVLGTVLLDYWYLVLNIKSVTCDHFRDLPKASMFTQMPQKAPDVMTVYTDRSQSECRHKIVGE